MKKPSCVPYADYGQGRELRGLVDELHEAQVTLIRAQDELGRALNEVDRVERVMGAIASEMRSRRKR